MAVMVTGGAGMLGLHVARALAEQGQSVVAYSTSGAPPRAELVLGEFASRVTFIAGNILDLARLRGIVEKFEVSGIIHTAALTLESQARADPHGVFSVNVGGTANVLEAARLGKMRRVVYIGSASEYGRRPDLRPIGEEEENVEGMYAETKFLGHRLGQRYRQVFGLDVLTVRVSSTYGPNTRFNTFRGLAGNTLIAHLCRAVAFGQEVTLNSGGDHRRDWTYAADTAQGVCLAFTALAPRYTVYNVASGRHHTVAEVIEAIRRIEPHADINVRPGHWEDDAFHEAGNLRGVLDIGRACLDLGYAPRYTLEDGLREYIEWWRQAGVDQALNTA
jgi:UDP-glucose 4-epimerase